MVGGWFTFNRTSMESKREYDSDKRSAYYLLIEPVWNRNKHASDTSNMAKHLLIEPVWNRNVETIVERVVEIFLLIEPVWNRNRIKERLVRKFCRAFNRTSMESKRVSTSVCKNRAACF